MYFFSNPHIVKNERLFIPYEMRAALGYHKGCRVTISQVSNASSTLQNQILVSSIPNERRQDLWNLKVCFRDRPGLLTELCGFLTQFNLDIWDCHVATRAQNSEVVVHLDFDAQLYESDLDLESAERKKRPGIWLQELYARIACEFIHDLSLRPDGKPDIYLKRNHLLSRSVKNLIQREAVEVQGGGILVPQAMISKIRVSFERVYGAEWAARLKQDRGFPLAMLVADPDLKGLSVTLFYPHTGHIHIRVEAKNQVGTIASITRVLFGKGFNVLQAYTRNLYAADRSLTDMLLYLPPEKDDRRNDAGLRRYVREAMNDRSLRYLDCRLVFPKPSQGIEQPKPRGRS